MDDIEQVFGCCWHHDPCLNNTIQSHFLKIFFSGQKFEINEDINTIPYFHFVHEY